MMTDALIVLAGVVSALGTLAGVALMLTRQTRAIADKLSMWEGRAQSPGFPRIPGIPERVETTELGVQRIEAKVDDMTSKVADIHHQTHTNGGGSIKDAVSRIEAEVARQGGQLDGVVTGLRESKADRAALHESVDQVAERLEASLAKHHPDH